jgi:hypothetical protein
MTPRPVSSPSGLLQEGPSAMRWARAAFAVALAVGGLLSAAPSGAAEKAGNFDVHIQVTSASQATTCTGNTTTGSADALASVACGGAKVVSRAVAGDLRVLARKDDGLPTAEGYGGAIATTAVRLVYYAGRQYIEMTVGW